MPRLWPAALAGLSALLVGIGLSRFGYSPLIPVLIQAGWFDAGQAGYLGATNLAGYLAGAALARRLAEHVPAPHLMRGAMLLGTAAFVACAFPLGFAWYFVWRLVSGAIGGVLMVLAAPTILAFTPPARRGLVGGVIFTGVGAGIALSGTLVPWVVRLGLPAAWLGFGALAAVLTAVLWQGMPPASGERPEVPAAAEAAGPLAATPAMVLLVLAYACSAIGFVPHTVFWVDYVARGLGQGLAAGGAYWALLGVAAASGPLLTGLLADRIGFARALRLGLLGQAAAVALPVASSHPAALACSSIGVGGFAIGVTALASGRAGELVRLEHRRQVWGWMTTGFSIAYAGAAYALAYLLGRTGAYGLLFGLGAAAVLLGVVLEAASARAYRRSSQTFQKCM